MDEKEIKAVDKDDMYQVLNDFPLQMQKGWQLAENIKITDKVDKIIVTGMGGSCLPGEILKSYVPDLAIPIFLSRGYSLPEFVDENTLVFAISYSGNTEETVEALKDAKKKRAQIVVISSGGKVQKIAEEAEHTYIEVPSGLQPRFAYGYQFLVILRVLQNSNHVESQDDTIEKTIQTLRKDIFKERAEDLAEKLQDKIPIIYTSDSLKAVSYKWKINFNENSKIPAFSNVFPELNHNEMNGYTLINGNFHIIVIKDDDDHPRIKKRMDIFKSLVKQRGIEITEIALSGPNRLSKMISAIYIGDWVSFYLAILNKQDPTPVKMIEDFKEKLVS
jgi:glucose/mannose-6-phosphate isomerase